MSDNEEVRRPWTSEKIRALPDASPKDVQEIADDFAKLEQQSIAWEQLYNSLLDLYEKSERTVAKLERERDEARKLLHRAFIVTDDHPDAPIQDLTDELLAYLAALEGGEG